MTENISRAVIVTGAGSGIGREIARTFAAEGSNVVVADKEKANGEETVNLIKAAGGNSLFIETDVRQESDIKRVVQETVKYFGKIDVLINNAGVSAFKPLFDLSAMEWDDIIASNLRSVFLASREAARVMKPGSSIVNISSTRAFMSEPDSEAYAASKGGIFALTHALAASLSEKRIRVNSISPGWIQNTDYENLKEEDHTQHWSGRVGKPSDIARACQYLCVEGNDFVNGENIVIDGGMTRKMIYD
ncbi:SDR family oxidoreductase [Peribacillus saganii]|uniref:SDR family oxidoreductase n=2 Tax=Peribacillus saganii TaxID=2303992 RepID=A0A372LSA5_9BACI|nr:SDR family oxidoreductase [Peribacillus saganii]RFU71068.1 SDR family oxidoreductase [Peribacillus saganii]